MGLYLEIYLDEAGSFHHPNTNFYFIGGVLFFDDIDTKKVRRAVKKKSLRVKKKLMNEIESNYFRNDIIGKSLKSLIREDFNDILKGNSFEIKSTLLTDEEILDYLKVLNNRNAVAIGILIDKDKVYGEIFRKKPELAHNFFVKTLIENVLEEYFNISGDKHILKTDNTKVLDKLSIVSDNRSTAIKNRNSVKDYLNLTLTIEKGMNFDLIHSQVDSIQSYNVQLADIICGSFYRVIYNHKSLNQYMDSLTFKYYISKFPCATQYTKE